MEDTDRSTSIDTNGAIAAPIDHENGKEAADDGGEVVEGEEDTVIY